MIGVREPRQPFARLLPMVALVLLLLASSAASVRAAQTFPDPFGGEGTFVDIRAGSRAEDIGDAFFLREGPIFRVRLFLTPPNTFIESHVCLSAEPFTERIPPGQCQYQAQGAAAATYDVTLPPSFFPSGTTAFDDPLGPFCAQVHIAYGRPGLARTSAGGGSAFAGWEPGSPFFGNICFPEVGPPEPPGPIVDVDKSGSLETSDGTVVFTVTATNIGTAVATDVTILDLLDPELSWVVPAGCTVVGVIATCPIGDLEPAATSAPLTFVGTPPPGFCGTVENRASATLAPSARLSSRAATAAVEIPCAEPEPDPLLLLTKVPASELVSVPGTVVWIVTLENAGPGDATDVEFVDELPSGARWSLGSGENVCSIDGTMLTCFAAVVPDGVFETLEIIGTVDGSTCGVMDNDATVTWSGGPADGSASAVSPPVEVVGCDAATPTPSPTPDGGVAPGEETPDDGEPDDGAELPDTGARTESSWLVALAGVLLLGSAILLAGRRRPVR